MTKVKKPAALRVNAKAPAAHLDYQSDLGNKAMRGTEPWQARKRVKHEAIPPRSRELFDRPVYKTGDGDVIGFRRPGSDLSYIKSKGLSV